MDFICSIHNVFCNIFNVVLILCPFLMNYEARER